MKKKLKGKKPQEKIERYLVEPNYAPIFGIEVTKDTDIDDIACNGEVHQTIKDLVFTTEIHRNRKTEDIEIEENTTLTIRLKEGIRLLWTETEGYILPGRRPKTRDEIREDLKDLDGIEGLK